MNKNHIIFLLFLLCFSSISIASASHYIKSDNPSSLKINNHFTDNQKTIISNLSKQTSLSNDEIYDLLDKGLSENEIKECYTITFFSSKSISEISTIFLSENDLDLTLKDFNISTDDFKKKLDSLFPDDFDVIFRNGIPWRQAPQKKL